MSKTEQKRIHNRFDEYEICHVFTESTQEFIQKTNQPIHSKFVLKCIIGTLLAVNVYLSHWGPWRWPSNYYILLFSVIFYYVASTIYAKLSPVDNTEGNLIGQYNYKGGRKIFTMNIGESKMDYVLQVLEGSSRASLGKKTFIYNEYFTEKGLFLEHVYQKHMSAFLNTLKQ